MWLFLHQLSVNLDRESRHCHVFSQGTPGVICASVTEAVGGGSPRSVPVSQLVPAGCRTERCPGGAAQVWRVLGRKVRRSLGKALTQGFAWCHWRKEKGIWWETGGYRQGRTTLTTTARCNAVMGSQFMSWLWYKAVNVFSGLCSCVKRLQGFSRGSLVPAGVRCLLTVLTPGAASGRCWISIRYSDWFVSCLWTRSGSWCKGPENDSWCWVT